LTSREDRFDTLLAWYFVLVWGSGYLASKTGMLYAAPFTFLTLRYSFGLVCMAVWVLVSRPRWPADAREWFHIGVAGLLMHAINLGASHHAQYLGMSAGITALLLATQPLFTAVIAHRFMGQRLAALQWLGVFVGLGGVVLVVWHKIDVRAVSAGSLAAVAISLTAITAGTLYQRVFCPTADLRSAAFIQFALSLAVLAPLAWGIEGFVVHWSWALLGAIAFLVILASLPAAAAGIDGKWEAVIPDGPSGSSPVVRNGRSTTDDSGSSMPSERRMAAIARNCNPRTVPSCLPITAAASRALSPAKKRSAMASRCSSVRSSIAAATSSSACRTATTSSGPASPPGRSVADSRPT